MISYHIISQAPLSNPEYSRRPAQCTCRARLSSTGWQWSHHRTKLSLGLRWRGWEARQLRDHDSRWNPPSRGAKANRRCREVDHLLARLWVCRARRTWENDPADPAQWPNKRSALMPARHCLLQTTLPRRPSLLSQHKQSASELLVGQVYAIGWECSCGVF